MIPYGQYGQRERSLLVMIQFFGERMHVAHGYSVVTTKESTLNTDG